MRQRLSCDFAVVTRVPTLLSTPSNELKLVSLCVITVTAFVTSVIINSLSRFSCSLGLVAFSLLLPLPPVADALFPFPGVFLLYPVIF